MSEAEEIRSVAKAMREIALRADTGESWLAEKHYDGLFNVFFKPSQEDESLDGEWDSPSYTQMGAAQAWHVAAWHPKVALALATWLDVVADQWERGLQLHDALPFVCAFLKEEK